MALGRESPTPPTRDRLPGGPRTPRRGPRGVKGLPGEFLVPSGHLRIREGEARKFASDRADFLGSHPEATDIHPR